MLQVEGQMNGLAACLCARRAVEGALRYSRQDAAALWRHVTTVEDSASLRQQLPALGLLAFVADGAILPRRR
jgi:predicted ABC-class ATPase